jgi:hypothetical protein
MNEIKDYFKRNKVGFFTNSFNPELLEMSLSLYRAIAPNEPIVIYGGIKRRRPFYGYRVFKRILSNWFIRLKYNYLIYIDEDCFISDVGELQRLVKHFIDNDYDFCGMPDGGVICHRCHNPVAINTFFTIYNLRSIRKLYNRRKASHAVYTPELDKFTPHHLIKTQMPDNAPPYCKIVEQSGQIPYDTQYDNFEPYYRIFFHLLARGAKPLYLDAADSGSDGGMTTGLMSHSGRVFCYHTWFARDYSSNPENRKRIDNIYHTVVDARN